MPSERCERGTEPVPDGSRDSDHNALPPGPGAIVQTSDSHHPRNAARCSGAIVDTQRTLNGREIDNRRCTTPFGQVGRPAARIHSRERIGLRSPRNRRRITAGLA
jgi:hypothetical protein